MGTVRDTGAHRRQRGAPYDIRPIDETAWSQILRSRLLLATVLGAIVAIALGGVLTAPLQDDIAWLLHVAREDLTGRPVYTALIELNPPLIILFSILAVRVAGLLGLAPGMIYHPLVAILLIGLIVFTATVLQRLGGVLGRRLAVTVAIAAILFLLPGAEFGQREHLIAALLAPWLALATVRLAGQDAPRGSAVVAGGLAALALGLKPYYLLVILAEEVVLFRHGVRPSRPETASLLIVTALLASLLLALFPAYLADAVPLGLRLYGGLDASAARLVVDARPLLLPLILVGLAVRMGRGDPHLALFVRPLLPAVLAGLVVYLVQAKGWAYHRLPAEIALALLVLGCLATLLARGRTRSHLSISRLVAGLAIALGLLAGTAVERQRAVLDRAWHAADTPERWLAALIGRTDARSIAGFSERLGPFFPVVDETGVRWTLRYPSTWALVGQFRSCAGCTGPVPDIRAQLVDDLMDGRPDLILFDESARFDALAVLLDDPRFVRVWSQYCPVATGHGLRAFRRLRPQAPQSADLCLNS